MEFKLNTKQSIINILIVLTLSISFSACSSKQESISSNTKVSVEEDSFLDEFDEEMGIEEKSDPLKGYNEVMTSFNDGAYTYVLRPIANGYKAVTHKEVRNSVSNFFHNIMFPIRLVNNLLQAKFSNSLEETERFVINTTIGIFGLFDPAKSYFGIEPHNEDFGQTLGFYGVGSGPHIVLPLFGPSNLRDMLSMVPDSALNPVDHHDNRQYNLVNSTEKTIFLKSFKYINKTAQSGEMYDVMKKDALDLYIYQRDMYEQYRQKQIEN